MNRSEKYSALPLAALSLGIVGAFLRWGLYNLAAEEYGLLAPKHPLSYLLLAVTVCALVFLAIVSKKKPIQTAAAPTTLVAVGYLIAAAGILVNSMVTPAAASGWLGLVLTGLGYLAPIALIVGTLSCLRGRAPGMACHLTGCLYYIFYIINHYRSWSSNPQLQDCVFALLGSMAMVLFLFYCAAQNVGLGRPALRRCAGLAAIFFCTVQLSSLTELALYFGSMLWALIVLCSPEAPVQEAAPGVSQDKEEAPHDPA